MNLINAETDINAQNVFKTLFLVDVSQMTEEKPTGKKDAKGKDVTLRYLSWMSAWIAVKNIYPSADYKIKYFQEKPYLYDNILGYMVFTEVTIENYTKSCWLPVMDNSNNAQKDHNYTIQAKKWDNNKKGYTYYDRLVEAATMFDINTALMRCLAKNLAMHGLGANLYAKHDLTFLFKDDLSDIPQEEPTIETQQADKGNQGLLNELQKNDTRLIKQLVDLYEIKKSKVPQDWQKGFDEIIMTNNVIRAKEALTYLKGL